jgi:uncharacterized FAD-dependent dehydrogenase
MNRYKISEIKLALLEEEENLPAILRSRLGMRHLDIENVEILKESVDARKKDKICRVLTVAFDTGSRLALEPYAPSVYTPRPTAGRQPAQRPVVVGFGPCGIFAALSLALMGLSPIVLERGKPVDQRDQDVSDFWDKGLLNEESNVQFGEGGAGAYSDGKLSTGTRDPRHRFILEQLAEAGASRDILYKAKPHIGTDVLKEVLVALRKKIISLGGEVRFGARVDDLVLEGGKVSGLVLSTGERLPVSAVLLAVGHSARDTFGMLLGREVPLAPKPFSVGVRMEHSQDWLNRRQYGDGDLAAVLGPADYKLVHHCSHDRGLYSFCMCPGGEIIAAASQRGGVVVNGMSPHARDGRFANSGILTDVRIEDYYQGSPLDGVAFQKRLEEAAFLITGHENRPLETTWGAFAANPDDPLRRILPDFAQTSLLEGVPAFGRKLPGFDRPDARMAGVETRSSSPLRILRGESAMSYIPGLFPAGEGAGYAGGILSAAADGLKSAEALAAYIVRA